MDRTNFLMEHFNLTRPNPTYKQYFTFGQLQKLLIEYERAINYTRYCKSDSEQLNKKITMTSKEIALIAVEKFQEEYPKRPLWQTMLEIEDLIDKHVEQQLSINDVSQQRELLISYNLDFYKGIKDVTLEDIELNVDKYLNKMEQNKELSTDKQCDIHGVSISFRTKLITNAISGIMANSNTMPTKQEHFDNISEDAIRVADAVIRLLSNEC